MGWLLVLRCTVALAAQSDGRASTSVDRAACVRAYAAHVHASYTVTARAADALLERVKELCAEPTEASLAAAREAWIAARRLYGRTEVFRFYGGPIDSPVDGVETTLNAWPVDEGYIDAVPGHGGRSIIEDAETFPNLTGAVLAMANERGGEANICTGWHAIEFALWGQDTFADGPGRRSHEVFCDGAPHAGRRRQHLLAITELLAGQLRGLRDAWAEGGAYRDAFCRKPEESLARMLRGMVALSGFEMAGERMAVAYETQDQEEEHSCFSDTTHLDFVANQEGIVAVFEAGGPHSLAALAREVDPALGRDLERKLAASLAAIRAIPAPFDRAFLGDDAAPGRKAILEAMRALEAQTDSLAALGLMLGYDIPLQPGG